MYTRTLHSTVTGTSLRCQAHAQSMSLLADVPSLALPSVPCRRTLITGARLTVHGARLALPGRTITGARLAVPGARLTLPGDVRRTVPGLLSPVVPDATSRVSGSRPCRCQRTYRPAWPWMIIHQHRVRCQPRPRLTCMLTAGCASPRAGCYGAPFVSKPLL